jgi:phage gp36-like protein
MPFITIEDMKTHLYPGAKNIISQGDDTKLTTAINAAISEAKGYCSRYNTAQLFDNAGNDAEWLPDPILQMHIKNMAKWHFMVLGNPNIDYEDAQNRYDQAVKWLKEVQAGRAVPPGWPPANPESKATFFHTKSNPKRNNHF